MIQLVIAVLAVLIASGLASGAEAALFAVNYSKVLAAVEKKKAGAKSLLHVTEDMRVPIMTIVVVNNIANIVGSILVGSLAADVFGSSWLGLFSAILTFLIIVFAEIVPKTVAEQHNEAIALLVARPVLILSKLLRPITLFVEIITRPFVSNTHSLTTSEDEIRVLAKLGRKEGVIDQNESRMIQTVFRLNDITAWDMMTPRPDVDALDGEKTVGSLRDKIMTLTHSRLPVYKHDLDQMIGVVHIRSLLEALAKDEDGKTIAELAAKVHYVPETMVGDDLIRHFQKEKDHLAVVVDSLGTVSGVITLEDVLEELVGEITDETDVEEDKIIRVSKSEILVDADTDVQAINTFFNIDLPDSGRIGELALEEFGYIPDVGETMQIGPITFLVDAATERRIERLRIKKDA